MFVALILTLFLSTLFAAGGHALGKAFPTPGAVLAGLLVGLVGFFWWYVLSDSAADGPGYPIGMAMLFWLTGFVVMFILGLASGAFGRPGLAIGAWLGTAEAAILVAWSPALSVVAQLVFLVCCLAGGMQQPRRATVSAG